MLPFTFELSKEKTGIGTPFTLSPVPQMAGGALLTSLDGLEPPHYDVNSVYTLGSLGRRFTYREAQGRTITLGFELGIATGVEFSDPLLSLAGLHTGNRTTLKWKPLTLGFPTDDYYSIPDCLIVDIQFDRHSSNMSGSITLFKEDVFIRVGAPKTVSWTGTTYPRVNLPLTEEYAIDFTLTYNGASTSTFVLRKEGETSYLDLGRLGASGYSSTFIADMSNHILKSRKSISGGPYQKIDTMANGAAVRPKWPTLKKGDNYFYSTSSTPSAANSRVFTYTNAIVGF